MVERQENEGELVEVEVVKKPKPNTALKRRQNISDSSSVHVQESVYPHAVRFHFAILTQRREEQLNASAGGDARKKKAPNVRSDAPEWYESLLVGNIYSYSNTLDGRGAYVRYETQIGGSLVDYGYMFHPPESTNFYADIFQ